MSTNRQPAALRAVSSGEARRYLQDHNYDGEAAAVLFQRTEMSRREFAYGEVERERANLRAAKWAGIERLIGARLRSGIELYVERMGFEKNRAMASWFAAMLDMECSPWSEEPWQSLWEGALTHPAVTTKNAVTWNFWTDEIRRGYLLEPPSWYTGALRLLEIPYETRKYHQERFVYPMNPHLNEFSADRVRRGVIPRDFSTSWGKPRLRAEDGRLIFGLSRHLAFVPGGREVGDIDVTALVPFPWRLSIAMKAISVIERLEESAWFEPEGEGAFWGTFVNSTVKAIRSSCARVKLFESEDLVKAYEGAVEEALQEIRMGNRVRPDVSELPRIAHATLTSEKVI